MAGTITRALRTPSYSEYCLNGVRPRWPEQFSGQGTWEVLDAVSMESGLDGRNNDCRFFRTPHFIPLSQWSPA